MPYKNKTDKAARDKAYRDSHKDEHREYQRLYHIANRDKHNERSRAYYQSHKDENGKREYELRLAVLDALGGRKCSRCNFDDIRALQIDHVNGGGVRHRTKSLSVISYYKYILEHLSEFQVLCANCNWIKRYENGEVSTRVYSSKVDKMYG